MSCSRIPPLSDFELLVALDGEADPEVTMHFAHCPDCRARAGQLQKLQDGLIQRLYRADCPSSLDIGEYHFGLLATKKAAAIEKHLTACLFCVNEQRLLADFLPEPSLTTISDLIAPLKKTMQVLKARLMGGFSASGLAGQPALAPVLSGLRGAADGPLMYEVEGAQVMAEVFDDDAHPGRKSILGLLTGTYQVNSFQAYLWQEARYHATVHVDDLGNFTIDNLTPGDYSLILSGPDLEIHLEDLPVRAN